MPLGKPTSLSGLHSLSHTISDIKRKKIQMFSAAHVGCDRLLVFMEENDKNYIEEMTFGTQMYINILPIFLTARTRRKLIFSRKKISLLNLE